jgi:hypothetical protein
MRMINIAGTQRLVQLVFREATVRSLSITADEHTRIELLQILKRLREQRIEIGEGVALYKHPICSFPLRLRAAGHAVTKSRRS